MVVAFVASGHAYRSGAPVLRMDMMMNSMCTIGNLRPNHRENNRQIMPQFGPAPFQLRVEQPHFPYAPGRKVKGEYCSVERPNFAYAPGRKVESSSPTFPMSRGEKLRIEKPHFPYEPGRKVKGECCSVKLRVEQPHFPYEPGRKVKAEYCSA